MEAGKLRIFKHAHAHAQFIFAGRDTEGKDTGIGGKAASFFQGEYRTDHPAEIAELEKEIANKHPLISQDADPTKREMLAEDIDPMVALKKKHIAEYLAAQQQATQHTNDRGNSDPTKSGAGTGVATTAQVGAAAVDSNQVGQPAATDAMKVNLAGLAGFKKA